MNRKMITGERIMYVDAATPLNCVFTARIRGQIDAGRLRQALAGLQRKHPLLRTRIEDGPVPRFITVPDIGPIPVRIKTRQSDEDWQAESEAEWSRLFDDPRLPLARLVWIRADEISELMLVLPHCVCDGTTFVALMRELLTLMDEPETNIGVSAGFRSVADLLPADFQASVGKKWRTRFFGLLARGFFLLKPGAARTAEGKSYALRWTLGKSETRELLAYAKEAGISVHVALCTAVLRAFQEVRGKQAHGKAICPADIRRYLPAIREDMMFAFAPIIELSLPKEGDFGTAALSLRDQLADKIKAMDAAGLLWSSEFFHASVRKMVSFLRATPGTHDVTFSNMGKVAIPETFDSFEVERLFTPTVAFPWMNPNTLVVSSYRGVMDFVFLSRDTFLSQEEAEAIRSRTLQLIPAHASA